VLDLVGPELLLNTTSNLRISRIVELRDEILNRKRELLALGPRFVEAIVDSCNLSLVLLPNLGETRIGRLRLFGDLDQTLAKDRRHRRGDLGRRSLDNCARALKLACRELERLDEGTGIADQLEIDVKICHYCDLYFRTSSTTSPPAMYCQELRNTSSCTFFEGGRYVPSESSLYPLRRGVCFLKIWIDGFTLRMK
jgi:hypothetical protein